MRMGLEGEGMGLLTSLDSSDEGSGELGETIRPPLGSGRLAWPAGDFHQFDLIRHVELSKIGELVASGQMPFPLPLKFLSRLARTMAFDPTIAISESLLQALSLPAKLFTVATSFDLCDLEWESSA